MTKYICRAKGYSEGSAYVGFMPDGRIVRFDTWGEYMEIYQKEYEERLCELGLGASSEKNAS